MQVLQAGDHKMLLLELETDVVSSICQELGLECDVQDGGRHILVEARAPGRQAPLLLFDAQDPGNLGWFARSQFYVNGQNGGVLQTPISIANQRDSSGFVSPSAIRMAIAKELPATFRIPGRQPVSEQMVYGVFQNFLNALLSTGVAVCGTGVIKPLAGRGESNAPRG
ncbi:MAG: hypothetical protein FJW39_32095 [Acidobacteria bacterium]|nr:hypothetical protein [Acidobacteriota bacterium]